MKISKQMDQKDCGLCVLQYFVKLRQNTNVDLDYLKLKASYGNEGININSLNSLANEFGLNIESYNCAFSALETLSKEDLPIVLLVNQDNLKHFVILEKIVGKKYYIKDSKTGKLCIYSDEELKKIFLEIALFIVKKAPITTKASPLKNLIYFKKHSGLLFFIALINLALIFGTSFFSKIVFDYILPNQSIRNLILLFIIFIWLNLLKSINLVIKNFVTKKISNSIEYNLNNLFLTKLNSLPIDKINKLKKGEYIKRMAFIKLIANYQANLAHSIVFDSLSLLASGLLMIYLNYILFGILFIFVFIISLIDWLIRKMIEKHHDIFVDKNTTTLISTIDLIESNFGSFSINFKNYLFNKVLINWINEKDVDYQMNKLMNFKSFFFSFFIGNLGNIIIFTFALFILNNKNSSGDIIMFLIVSNFFVSPFNNLSSLATETVLYKKYFDSINFVLNIETPTTRQSLIKTDKINSIQLQNIEFAYEIGKNILKIDNLNIAKNIQIKGKNGCGKSTLLNLIFGNLGTFKGELSFNDVDAKNLDFYDLQDKIILISPTNYFPNIAFLEYITNGKRANILNLNENLKNSELTSLIKYFDINLNSNITNNGQTLSTGQKQFLSLLRLFSQKFDVILLDEAFENIDAKSANELKTLIKKFQKESLFIEISHSKNYIFTNNEVGFEEINKH
ncbi:Mbov_0121 family peptidase domain-containing ABC transporter [Mycoplasmopsis iners]|uniref:Mbov_0121 family peptidase domain-containing ABC transporter n=1 Tax=Mycoplasmopsis iners TaxID=76630 RepID=UPI0004970325|nr:cysteine peptidase family C39 domain-containing protein [Mycoplasmopsis iners]